MVRRSLSWYTRSLNEYQDGVNQTIEYHAKAITAITAAGIAAGRRAAGDVAGDVANGAARHPEQLRHMLRCFMALARCWTWVAGEASFLRC